MILTNLEQAAKVAKSLKEAEEALLALPNVRGATGRLVFETTAALGNGRYEIPIEKARLDNILRRYIADAKAELTALGVTFPAPAP